MIDSAFWLDENTGVPALLRHRAGLQSTRGLTPRKDEGLHAWRLHRRGRERLDNVRKPLPEVSVVVMLEGMPSGDGLMTTLGVVDQAHALDALKADQGSGINHPLSRDHLRPISLHATQPPPASAPALAGV